MTHPQDKNINYHQSKKGSSFLETSGDNVSESGYSEKFEVSPAFLYSRLMYKFQNLLTLFEECREQEFSFRITYTSLNF